MARYEMQRKTGDGGPRCWDVVDTAPARAATEVLARNLTFDAASLIVDALNAFVPPDAIDDARDMIIPYDGVAGEA